MNEASIRAALVGLTAADGWPLSADVRLSVTADQRRPLVLGDPRGPIAYEFAKIGATLRRWLAEQEGARRAG